MKEREFQFKLRDIFEGLRGHIDCFTIRVYWTLDDKGNVILDEDSLREDFEEKLKQVKEILN